jgi:hypothetical protein
MSGFVTEQQQEFALAHQEAHRTNSIIRFKAIYCQACYPPPARTTTQFNHFWDWISTYCGAQTYTSYTTTTFNLFIHIFRTEPITNDTVSYRITDFSYRIVGSLTYAEENPYIKGLVYSLVNLTPRTNYFSDPVPERVFSDLRFLINIAILGGEPYITTFNNHYDQTILVGNRDNSEGNNRVMNDSDDNIEQQVQQPPQPAMNQEAQEALRDLLTNILGPDGLNLRRADEIQRPREVSIVKVEPFKGREDEDPYEWIESFKHAATANNWPTYR